MFLGGGQRRSANNQQCWPDRSVYADLCERFTKSMTHVELCHNMGLTGANKWQICNSSVTTIFSTRLYPQTYCEDHAYRTEQKSDNEKK